jgi:hypothetical protein
VTEEATNIKPKKKWAVKEPTQMKFGSWYSCVMDPDTKELVHEVFDFTKQMAFNSCVEWCRMNNKLAEEIENAKSTEMGSTLAPSSTNNVGTV